jgi:hypothetical protein
VYRYPSVPSQGSKPCRASGKAGLGALGTYPGPGKCRETATWLRRQGSTREPGNRIALPLPKRGSPAHPLIRFVRGLRLDGGIAREALFIEKAGSGLVFLPGRLTASRRASSIAHRERARERCGFSADSSPAVWSGAEGGVVAAQGQMKTPFAIEFNGARLQPEPIGRFVTG